MESIDLTPYRWIVVNSSGGKDSQTALRAIVAECERQGVSKDRVVISHQCLGKMEWEGTLDLVKAHAAFYGLRLEVSSYRNRAGESKTLLDYVRQRGFWPSNKQRFCTSEFKRGPGGRVLVKLSKEAPGKILNVYGFRADESPARAKKPVFIKNARFSSTSREVFDFLPIRDLTLSQVWNDIKESGVPHHSAYDLGMPRLSCRFCIFAPRNALLIAGKANPDLLDEYCQVEAEIGHTFRQNQSLAEIRDAIRAGEVPTVAGGDWNM